MDKELQRLEAVSNLVRDLESAFPDAKVFEVDVHFAWQETEDYDPELCPVVSIKIWK